MKKTLLTIVSIILIGSIAVAGDLELTLDVAPENGTLGNSIKFSCQISKGWDGRTIKKAKILIWNASSQKIVNRVDMAIDQNTASYDFVIPDTQAAGEFKVKCIIWNGSDRIKKSMVFNVIIATDKLTGIDAHLSIDSYEGPSTCIKCHEDEARQMLNRVHM